jgi:hypothetical protein
MINKGMKRIDIQPQENEPQEEEDSQEDDSQTVFEQANDHQSEDAETHQSKSENGPGPSNVTGASGPITRSATKAQESKEKTQKSYFGFIGYTDTYDEHFVYNCVDEAHLDDPKTLVEIMTRSDKKKWLTAMQDEYSSLMKNKTWEETTLPKGCKTVKNKWIFKTKKDASGKIVRFKARLVAKGYSQIPGVDFHETFSPVVRYTSLRILIAFAAEQGFKVYQFDAVTAFLQGRLDECIYMEQPEGYRSNQNKVLKLKKPIYGLKQAGRNWNMILTSKLKEFKLQSSLLDPCVFFDQDRKLYLAIYVDDLLIFTNDQQKLTNLKKFLFSTFDMMDLGMAESCLGIRIDQRSRSITIDQESYIRTLGIKYLEATSKRYNSPCDTNVKCCQMSAYDRTNDKPYRELLGSLLYVANGTRPDIAYAVGALSRYSDCYNDGHWKALQRVLNYIVNTADEKLIYSRGKIDTHGFVDSDFASDIIDRKSTSGYIFKMSNAAIIWSSKKQNIVTISSTEAEYVALTSAVSEALWLRNFIHEVQNKFIKMKIFCDNMSTIRMSDNEAYRPRTKHIDVRFHFIREVIKNGEVDIKYVESRKNVADVLTKELSKEATKAHRCSMLGHQNPSI